MNKDTEIREVVLMMLRQIIDRGEIIAVFPALAGDNDPYATCLSYLHIGQHGACDADISTWTRPAKPEEYADLQSELESIGYNLQIAKRFTHKDLEARKEQCKL